MGRLKLKKKCTKSKTILVQRESVAAEIPNSVHGLVLTMRNLVNDFKNMEVITPNRLRLGRNNDRSPVSSMKVTGNSQKMLEENKKV